MNKPLLKHNNCGGDLVDITGSPKLKRCMKCHDHGKAVFVKGQAHTCLSVFTINTLYDLPIWYCKLIKP